MTEDTPSDTQRFHNTVVTFWLWLTAQSLQYSITLWIFKHSRNVTNQPTYLHRLESRGEGYVWCWHRLSELSHNIVILKDSTLCIHLITKTQAGKVTLTKTVMQSHTHILLLMNAKDHLITLSLTRTDKTHARCAAGVCLPYLLA